MPTNLLGLKKGEVRLDKYSGEWKKVFLREKLQLQRALKEKVLSIEHVGSTSLPKMSAKPIIDIVLGVRTLRKLDSLLPALKKAGYGNITKVSHHRLQVILTKAKQHHTFVHLHILRHQGKIWQEYIYFRDTLSAHPKIAQEYENLKKDLARKYPMDRSTYTEAKQKFVLSILRKRKT